MHRVWLTYVLLPVLFAVLAAAGHASVPQPTPIASANAVVNSSAPADLIPKLLSAIAWPLVALIGILMLHRPLGEFLRSIAGRATKVSLFQVAVELNPAPEFHAPPEIATEFRDATFIAISSDSTSSLFRGLDDGSPGEYLTVDLGTEAKPRWLTSRLYIFTVMLERMRGVRCVVFTKRAEDERNIFLGYASSSDIRWRLAMRYPWLERAYATAYSQAAALDVLYDGAAMSPFAITSLSGRLTSSYASQLVAGFLAQLQSAILPPTASHQWVLLHARSQTETPIYEHAKWIEPSRISGILQKSLRDDAVSSSPDISPDEVARMILRRKGPFVARTTEKGRLTNLIDRNELLEVLAVREGQVFPVNSADSNQPA